MFSGNLVCMNDISVTDGLSQVRLSVSVNVRMLRVTCVVPRDTVCRHRFPRILAGVDLRSTTLEQRPRRARTRCLPLLMLAILTLMGRSRKRMLLGVQSLSFMAARRVKVPITNYRSYDPG